MSKPKIGSGVRVDAYEVISRAVEEGVAHGYRRAHKYTDKPSEDVIGENIVSAVMNELSEVLIFGDEE